MRETGLAFVVGGGSGGGNGGGYLGNILLGCDDRSSLSAFYLLPYRMTGIMGKSGFHFCVTGFY